MKDQRLNPSESTRIQTPLESCCADFLHAWLDGRRPDLTEFLNRVSADEWESGFASLLRIEIERRRQMGESPTPEEYIVRFSALETVIDEVFQQTIHSSASAMDDETSLDWGVRQPDAVPAPHTMDDNFPPNEIQVTPKPRRRAVPPPNPGKIGKYETHDWLGGGGFGDVWKAWDPDLSRFVAIKVLLSHRSKPSEIESLKEEGKRLAKLQERGARIVGIYEAGVDRVAGPYLVTRYLDGGNLGELLKRRKFDWKESTSLIAGLAETLAVAHSEGIYHRDIKPENILLDGEGTAYLGDFGLAASQEELEESPTKLGSRFYMPPEQANWRGHLVDGRSDIYSLGVVLYRMLCGRLPYPARDPEQYERYLVDMERRPAPPREINPDVPTKLESVCLRCLEKDPDERYSSVRDVARELRTLCGNNKTKTFRRAVLMSVGVLVSAALFMTAIRVFQPSRDTWKTGQPDPRETWFELLDQELEMIAGLKSAPTDFFQHDTAERTLRLRSEGNLWVLAAPFHGHPPLRIRGSILIGESPGTAGFYWGSGSEPELIPKVVTDCYAIVLDSVSPATAKLRLMKISIGPFVDSMVWVNEVSVIAESPVEVSCQGFQSLDVAVGVREICVTLNGRVIWEHGVADLATSVDLLKRDGGVGIVARGKSMVIRNAMVMFGNQAVPGEL